MSKKLRTPTRKRPSKKFGFADPALRDGRYVPSVVRDAEVVGARKAAGDLPLDDGWGGDAAGASNGSAGRKTDCPLKGVGVVHAPNDKTAGYSLSITRSYGESADTYKMAPTYGSFWTRLLEAMADRGLPQTQVAAAKLGRVTQPAARKWAEGGLPDVDKIIDIAKRLDVSLDWLLTGEGPKHPPRYSSTDPHFEQMLSIWTGLDAEARKRLVDIAGLIEPGSKKSK
jgi:transcriptional regulator with XRE-family HTH domain